MRISGVYKIISNDARGKFGRGGGFGRISLGYNFFGFYSIYSGIWQKKYFFGKPYLSKMKFYRPTNPQTIRQQNRRYICSYGWVMWGSLSTNEKSAYNSEARELAMSGANLFMSRWLKNPTSGFGYTFFGHNTFGYY